MAKESRWLPTNPYEPGLTKRMGGSLSLTIPNPDYEIYETAKVETAKKIAGRLKKYYKFSKYMPFQTLIIPTAELLEFFKEIEES